MNYFGRDFFDSCRQAGRKEVGYVGANVPSRAACCRFFRARRSGRYTPAGNCGRHLQRQFLCSRYRPCLLQIYWGKLDHEGTYGPILFTVRTRDLLGNTYNSPAYNFLSLEVSLPEKSEREARDYLPTFLQAVDIYKADVAYLKPLFEASVTEDVLALFETGVYELINFREILANELSPAAALFYMTWRLGEHASWVVGKVQEYHMAYEAVATDKAYMDLCWKIYSDIAKYTRYPISAELTGGLEYDDPKKTGIYSFLDIPDASSGASAPITTTPEPSTLLLLWIGLAGLIGLRRRA